MASQEIDPFDRLNESIADQIDLTNCAFKTENGSFQIVFCGKFSPDSSESEKSFKINMSIYEAIELARTIIFKIADPTQK